MKKISIICIILLCISLCGCMGTKEVSNHECSVTILDHTFFGSYTGTIENKVPNGQGSFYFSDGKQYISYKGQWEDGTPSGEGKLESSGLIVTIGNCAPSYDMPAYFSTDNHKTSYLDYSGNWISGKLDGYGTVRTNLYTIKFYDGVIRTGEYMGEMLNGLADGEGSFTAKNSDGIFYTYSGEWKNGLFNGYGEQTYDSNEYYSRIGTFVDGKFTPSPLDFYISRGTYSERTYTISDSAKDFLTNYPEIFINNEITSESIEYEDKFNYNAYAKNPDNYGSKLLTLTSLRVVQIFEYDFWDNKCTYIIATDGSQNVYCITFYGLLENIYENSYIKATVLPLDYYTYPNVSGTHIWAIACAGVKIN